MELPFADNYFDAVLTDPPYYDNISYADLSDFFYVWLKRSAGDQFPSSLIIAGNVRNRVTVSSRKLACLT